MISPMSSGMPQMDATRRYPHAAFRDSDANGSGELDATEFAAMIGDSRIGQNGRQGQVDTDALFAKLDADGSGQLSEAELSRAHERLTSRFQSTMQAFGGEAAVDTSSPRETQTSLDMLLQAIENDEQDDLEAGPSRAAKDDLLAQPRVRVDGVASAYADIGRGADAGLALSA